jgi:hypothetical protein
MAAVEIPLASCVDELIAQLASATASRALRDIDGMTLLGERAMLAGMRIPGRTSAGGGCRLFDARGDRLALNLSRPDDRELLPALFQQDTLDPNDDAVIARLIARSDAQPLLERARSMGLAMAAENEPVSPNSSVLLCPGLAAERPLTDRPRVVDLAALWAGPLASHLLWLAGADVVKVESRSRPDGMRNGNRDFYSLINQGKASVVIDFANSSERAALVRLLTSADIVIEAARPRALLQLGIDAEALVRNTPGLVWITITAHGTEGKAAHWVGFGDDCGVAGGLSAALYAASGCAGFVGDAIADPLTGVHAALAAWEAYASRQGGRFGLAMSQVVASCLARAREKDATALERSLQQWADAVGQPFPPVKRRGFVPAPPLGAHTREILDRGTRC